MGKYVSRYGSIQAALEAMGLKSPHVAYVSGSSNTDGLVYVNVGDNKEIVFEDNGSGEISGSLDMSSTPLYFVALENSTISLINDGDNNPNIEYSYDNEAWTQWDYSALSLNAGEKLYFRGNNPDGFSQEEMFSSTFDINGSVGVKGNLISLVDKSLSSQPVIDGENCFYMLFASSAINYVNIYNDVISVEMFYNCSSLSSFKSPNLTYVNWGAFRQCSSLSSFEAPNLTYVDDSAFESCSSLSSFEAPNLTYIGINAFNNCYSLTSFEAPNMTYADECAFANVGTSTADGCDFYFDNETPAQIDSSAFDDAKINHIYVPASAVDTYKTATNWTEYASYITAIS